MQTVETILEKDDGVNWLVLEKTSYLDQRFPSTYSLRDIRTCETFFSGAHILEPVYNAFNKKAENMEEKPEKVIENKPKRKNRARARRFF